MLLNISVALNRSLLNVTNISKIPKILLIKLIRKIVFSKFVPLREACSVSGCSIESSRLILSLWITLRTAARGKLCGNIAEEFIKYYCIHLERKKFAQT